MTLKWGESASSFPEGCRRTQQADTASTSVLKRNRKRRRSANWGKDSCTGNVDTTEARFILRDPRRLSRMIVCCCFALQTLSFVTDNIPTTSAFFPNLHKSSTERISPPIRKVSPIKIQNRYTKTSLFGIKGFRKWFEEAFPTAIRKIDVNEHQDTFDHVLVDMNQILHVILRRAKDTETANKLLMRELSANF